MKEFPFILFEFHLYFLYRVNIFLMNLKMQFSASYIRLQSKLINFKEVLLRLIETAQYEERMQNYPLHWFVYYFFFFIHAFVCMWSARYNKIVAITRYKQPNNCFRQYFVRYLYLRQIILRECECLTPPC